MGSQTTSLCGRNAVQVAHRVGGEAQLRGDGRTNSTTVGEVQLQPLPAASSTSRSYEFTVFPDGRAIIKGTNDIDKARTLYAKYVGH